MSEDLSTRARAILEAAERAAAAQASGGPAAGDAQASGGPAAGDAQASGGPAAGDAQASGGPAAGDAQARGGPAAGAAPAPHAPRQDWSRPVESAPIPATPPGQLLAIVDQVMSAAEAARRRLDELSATLDELTRRVDAAGRAGIPAGRPAGTPAAERAGVPAVPPADTPLRARPRPPTSWAPGGGAPTRGVSAAGGSGGSGTASGTVVPGPGSAPTETLAATAKLIAVEMAVAGASRMDVDRRLRDQLGMPTTHEVLDDVFGADSPPTARLA